MQTLRCTSLELGSLATARAGAATGTEVQRVTVAYKLAGGVGVSSSRLDRLVRFFLELEKGLSARHKKGYDNGVR